MATTNAHVVVRGVLAELGLEPAGEDVCRCGEQSWCVAAGQQRESEAVGTEYVCDVTTRIGMRAAPTK